jgi:aminopeptidase N
MRPALAADIGAIAGIPRYNLKLEVDPAAGMLSGSEQVTFSNLMPEPLADVALRLYPNFPRDVFGKGGDVRMDVSGVSIAGQRAAFDYAAQRTAVVIPLVPALASGQSTTVAISFMTTIVPARDGTWPLPSYYPMIAARGDQGWRLDVTRFADHVYAESALYSAEVRVPAALQVVASGSTTRVEAHDDGTTSYIVQTGPIREFALTVGDFDAQRAMAGDVNVNIYTAHGSRLDSQQISQVAAGALVDFDQRFGPYPYRELDIHLLPYDYDGGDEFPGLILLYCAGQVGTGTRYVAAHEVAHQWWYGVVGNDIYREPWLDEAFAQYSGIVYAEDVAGPEVAASDWEREVQRRYRGAIADGDLPIGLPITEYPNFNVYYRTIYGKGAVFLQTLREQLGDDNFFKGLQLYYHRHRYGVATTRDVQRAFEDASGRDLDELFRAWV